MIEVEAAGTERRRLRSYAGSALIGSVHDFEPLVVPILARLIAFRHYSAGFGERILSGDL